MDENRRVSHFSYDKGDLTVGSASHVEFELPSNRRSESCAEMRVRNDNLFDEPLSLMAWNQRMQTALR